MSKRGFAVRHAVERSLNDEYTSPEDLANHELAETEKIIANGDPRWQEQVAGIASTLREQNSLDFVANPETKGWSPDGISEGIGKRLDAAMNSWRMDASGGHPVAAGEDGGVVWGAGWDPEQAANPAFGYDWRKYIVACKVSGENGRIAVDPSSVAVFVGGRKAGLEGRDEWTLFVGGEQLADEVASRIGGGLIVDTVNKAKKVDTGEWKRGKNKVVSGIGRAGLKATVDTSWDNHAHHSIENPTTGAVAEVIYSRDFGSSSLHRPEDDVYAGIAYPIFQDVVASFSTVERQ